MVCLGATVDRLKVTVHELHRVALGGELAAIGGRASKVVEVYSGVLAVPVNEPSQAIAYG